MTNDPNGNRARRRAIQQHLAEQAEKVVAVTSPAGNTEPTAEQRAEAVAAVEKLSQVPPSMFLPAEWESVNHIARALAAAVTAERERMRVELSVIAHAFDALGDVGPHDPQVDRAIGAVARDAARRIREVTG